MFVLLLPIGPSDIMPAILSGQVDTICLMICGYDDAAAIKYLILTSELLIDAQRIRRAGDQRLHMIVELESITFSQVARFANAQDYGFQETIKSPHYVWGRCFLKIPRANRLLHRFEDCVFSYPMTAA